MHHFTPALILPLLMSLLLLMPEVGRAYQAPEADTTYVLTIYQQARSSKSPSQHPPKKIGHLSAGAVVNLHLSNGRTYRKATVEHVGKSELMIGGEKIAIADISRLMVIDRRKRRYNFLFHLAALLGEVVTISYSFNRLFYDNPPHYVYLVNLIPLVMAIFGSTVLAAKERRFNSPKSRFSLSTAPLKSLSARVREKLSRRTFVK